MINLQGRCVGRAPVGDRVVGRVAGAVGLLLTASTLIADVPSSAPSDGRAAQVIRAGDRDLQQVIDQAPANSTILCDRNRQLTLSTSIRIAKPLTVRGLNLRLPPNLGSTSLVTVTAKGVTISDFVLTGNGDTASQDERAPLMQIGAGDFCVERGSFINSSKDGVAIDGDLGEGDLVGGVVRDVVGREVIRDTVSICGSPGGERTGRVCNVLVDNVRCYHSRKRGGVEVSDGTDNITVRKVYTEDSLYAVDVQDHEVPSQINRNVVLEDIHALRCKHALRTNNHPFGHANLTVRDITARECTDPIQISNTANLSVSNVRVIDHHGKGYPVRITDCQGVSVRDVTIENTDHKGPAMLLENCDRALVDGFTLRGQSSNLGVGICFRIEDGNAYSGLRLSNVLAPEVTDVGILLDVSGKKGTLSDYVISGNIAKVRDGIEGSRRVIANNLP